MKIELFLEITRFFFCLNNKQSSKFPRFFIENFVILKNWHFFKIDKIKLRLLLFKINERMFITELNYF